MNLPQAGIKLKNTMQHSNNITLKPNVSNLERALVLAFGAYLIYKASTQKDVSITKMTAGVGMLVRGISGYCPLYDTAKHLQKDRAS